MGYRQRRTLSYCYGNHFSVQLIQFIQHKNQNLRPPANEAGRLTNASTSNSITAACIDEVHNRIIRPIKPKMQCKRIAYVYNDTHKRNKAKQLGWNSIAAVNITHRVVHIKTLVVLEFKASFKKGSNLKEKKLEKCRQRKVQRSTRPFALTKYFLWLYMNFAERNWSIDTCLFPPAPYIL